MAENSAMRSNRGFGLRALRLILVISVALGVAFAASEAGPVRDARAIPTDHPLVSSRGALPSHWTWSRESIDPVAFVRRADQRDLSWIRGDGY